MILNILASIFSLFLAVILIQAAQVYIKTRRALEKFLKESNGVPLARGFQPVGGHLNTLFGKDKVWKLLDEEHKRLGSHFGWFFSDKPGWSTVDLDVIKQIVLDDPDAHPNRIDSFGIPVDEIEIDSIILARDDQWRRLRKAVAPAFSSHKIKAPNVQSEFNTVTNKFIESIETRLGRAEEERGENFVIEDVEDILHRYSLDMVFTCFYKQDNLIDFSSKVDSWQKMVIDGMETFNNFAMRFTIIFGIFKPLLQWLIIQFHQQGFFRRKMLEFIKHQTRMNLAVRKQLKAAQSGGGSEGTILEQHNVTLEDGSQFKRNLIDHIIDQFHDGKLTKSEYLHTSFFLFMAANKTSADTLSKLLYNLAAHQDVQTKLRKSILADGIESEYLSWCINESMRLFPAGPMGCSRCVSSDVKLDSGKVIPKGTFVLMPVYTIHRLPEYWGPHADEFRPERWADSRSHHPVQFVPFWGRQAGVSREDFALTEMKTITDTMIRRYKFDYVPSETDIMDFKSPFLVFLIAGGPTYIKISRL